MKSQLEINLDRLEFIKSRPMGVIENDSIYNDVVLDFRYYFSDTFCLLEDSNYYRLVSFAQKREEQRKKLYLVK
jgi:hypothetical protein